MMKVKIYTCFLIFLYCFSSLAVSSQLIIQAKEVLFLIRQAKNCMPSVQKNKDILMCTGISITSKDLRFLKSLTLPLCFKEFRKLGYDLNTDLESSLKTKYFNEEEREDFFKSTKMAQVYHDKKRVVFKTGATRGDCLHEVVHFYQRIRPSKNKNHPLKRKERADYILNLINKEIEVVEGLERSGNKEKAQQMAKDLGPLIQLLGQWRKLITWLDEKEVYTILWENRDLLNLNEMENETNLANLVRLKEYLPWQIREEYKKEARLYLKKKYDNLKKIEIKAEKFTDEKALKRMEWSYLNLYQKGKITKSDYETRVLSARILYGRFLSKNSSGTREKLKGFIYQQKFDSPKEGGAKGSFSYGEKDGLPVVTINGFDFVLDWGAEESVFPWEFVKKVSFKELVLIGEKTLKTADGKSALAPKVQLLRKIMIGKGGHLINPQFLIHDLGLGKYDGVLGLADFINGKWVWDLKKKQISPLTSKLTTGISIDPDFLKYHNQIEFFCDKVKLRLDSGSQINGDMVLGMLGKKLEARVQKGMSCPGKVKLKGPFSTAIQTQSLFDHDVHLNLGYPWLKQYEKVEFDFLNKLLRFTP
jgi:hypothetical protein